MNAKEISSYAKKLGWDVLKSNMAKVIILSPNKKLKLTVHSSAGGGALIDDNGKGYEKITPNISEVAFIKYLTNLGKNKKAAAPVATVPVDPAGASTPPIFDRKVWRDELVALNGVGPGSADTLSEKYTKEELIAALKDDKVEINNRVLSALKEALL